MDVQDSVLMGTGASKILEVGDESFEWSNWLVKTWGMNLYASFGWEMSIKW